MDSYSPVRSTSKRCPATLIVCTIFFSSGGEWVSSGVRGAIAAVQTVRQRPSGPGQEFKRAGNHPEPQRQRPERGTGPQTVPWPGQAQTGHQIPPKRGRDSTWRVTSIHGIPGEECNVDTIVFLICFINLWLFQSLSLWWGPKHQFYWQQRCIWLKILLKTENIVVSVSVLVYVDYNIYMCMCTLPGAEVCSQIPAEIDIFIAVIHGHTEWNIAASFGRLSILTFIAFRLNTLLLPWLCMLMFNNHVFIF